MKRKQIGYERVPGGWVKTPSRRPTRRTEKHELYLRYRENRFGVNCKMDDAWEIEIKAAWYSGFGAGQRVEKRKP